MCDFFRVFQTILRFFKMFSVEVQLFYNAVLVSAVQQSELVSVCSSVTVGVSDSLQLHGL